MRSPGLTLKPRMLGSTRCIFFFCLRLFLPTLSQSPIWACWCGAAEEEEGTEEAVGRWWPPGRLDLFPSHADSCSQCKTQREKKNKHCILCHISRKKGNINKGKARKNKTNHFSLNCLGIFVTTLKKKNLSKSYLTQTCFKLVSLVSSQHAIV